MAEIIVKYKEDTDRMKVKDGEYVQDLIRCKDCKKKNHCCRSMAAKDEGFCSDAE